MDKEKLVNIEGYLQREDVQKRIRNRMLGVRSNASVTIGQVVKWLNFSENQLRDWEKRGWVHPQRALQIEASGQEGRSINRHRQYSIGELDRLSIIRELLDAGYSHNEITRNVTHIWETANAIIEQIETLSMANGQQRQTSEFQSNKAEIQHTREVTSLHIDQYAYTAYNNLFWRYYASQTLRLSIMLICAGIPQVPAGLVLPVKNRTLLRVDQTNDLSQVGKSLIGWLGQTRTFYTYLTEFPYFQYPSDYQVLPLKSIEEDISKDITWIVMERAAARHITLRKAVVDVVRRLLTPIYEDVEQWERYFGQGRQALVLPAIDFNSSLNLSDIILNGFTNMVIRLGGKISGDKNRWHFCCILLPNDPLLPIQQQHLVVQAQSKNAPYRIGITDYTPDESVISLSLRAFQSGHVAYRAKVSDEDPSIPRQKGEMPTRSAIALPVGGEDNLPVAVLYVVSDETDAFSTEDQRLLRMMGRMIQELLMIYQARLLVTQRLPDLITDPANIDPTFKNFLSENDFIHDVELILTAIQVQVEEIDKSSDEGLVSFIAIDIDNQANLANKYGNRLTKNLNRTFGKRIQGHLRSLVSKKDDYKLYHIYGDRYYLILQGIPLTEVRAKAELLKQTLEGSFKVDAVRINQAPPPDSVLDLKDITVRLGITSYEKGKLREIIQRYPLETSLASTVALITRSLDEVLNLGKHEGGNIIISWDPKSWGYIPWPQKE